MKSDQSSKAVSRQIEEERREQGGESKEGFLVDWEKLSGGKRSEAIRNIEKKAAREEKRAQQEARRRGLLNDMTALDCAANAALSGLLADGKMCTAVKLLAEGDPEKEKAIFGDAAYEYGAAMMEARQRYLDEVAKESQDEASVDPNSA